MTAEPSFDVKVENGDEPNRTLLIGVADMGAAALTALDYLISQLESQQIGVLGTHDLPDITPVTNGEPRHPIRLFNVESGALTVMMSEAFLPVSVADPLSASLVEWANASGVEEIAVLYGPSFPHGEHEHVLFHVGTHGYRDRHFKEDGSEAIRPLPGGVMDGIVGELLSRGLDEESPLVGVLVTPSHPPGPDFEAAERILRGVEMLYGIEIDERELHRRAEEVKRYYEELVQRLQSLRESDQPIGSRDFPEDRMYM